MSSKAAQVGLVALVAALVLTPAPIHAIAPVLLLLIKQMAQQAATSMFKDMLLSGLSGMGCKGIALSNALAAVDLRGGGAAGLLGGMPQLPAGLSMPTIPTLPGMPGGVGAGMLIGGPAEALGGEQAALLARSKELISLPPGFAMDPAQMAMMARAQQAMSQPLSPAETLATIDELFELGFLPRAIQTELKECMVLLPAAIPALGMGMGMLKPMLPQMRQAREELRALSPAEQDEVAAMLAQQVNALPADQRTALMEHIDSGFFPPAVSAGVKARVAAK